MSGCDLTLGFGGGAPGGDAPRRFRIWAPWAREAALVATRPGASREERHPLRAAPNGHHEAQLDLPAGTRYWVEIARADGSRLRRPDPASRLQPEGVHGPSAIVEADFPWSKGAWRGLPLEELVIYELHVGAFSREGTFEGVIPSLDRLRALGVTAVELMPVAQFPGSRNWGYDGVLPFAAQSSYGGPLGLKRLVDACHARGLAVILDVVYNHIGPEGSYLGDFAPYFTDRYKTPWGRALNFDGPDSDEVRRYFIENALYWVDECRIDGLRLDAVHAILDTSAYPFLAELADVVAELAAVSGRAIYLIAESDLNDRRVIAPRAEGGLGHAAQWSDDLHHALHSLLTRETDGYYSDFGALEHLARAYQDAFVYSGQRSEHRRRRHGNTAAGLPGSAFVVCSQNHDQVGNRMLGERLTTLVSFERLKLAAAAVVLSPYIPLLFMGEEYGEPAPFLYFVSHGDETLIRAVREGRREEFASFAWKGEAPDPQAEETFLRSRLDPTLRERTRHALLEDLYRELLRLRRETPPLADLDRGKVHVEAHGGARTITVTRGTGTDRAALFLHFGDGPVAAPAPASRGEWTIALDTASGRWGGPAAEFDGARVPGGGEMRLAPWSAALLLERRAEGAS